MNNKIKERFPFFKNNEEMTYLDSAASSLKLKTVIDSLTDFYTNNGSNIHRGVYKLAYDATEAYEETRKEVSLFLNASIEEIVFTKGTTDSLNKIANFYADTLSDSDEIITTELEHHSSILPWKNIASKKNAKLKFIELTNEGRVTIDNFKNILTDKTKFVVINHVSNVLGYKTPIKEITKLAHSKNAIVILDAAQSVSHLKIDVKDLDVDYIAFSSHKMYGPNGVGVLYGKKELLDLVPPVEFGGEMAHIITKESMSFKSTPYKFEAGTPVIAEVIAFKEAIKFLNEIGLKDISKHEMDLRKYTIDKLLDMKDVEIYNLESDSPIITFNIKGVHPHDAASIFDSNNVAIRAGHHCAQLTMAFLKTQATLRASFAIYNTYNDCDRFISAVKDTIDFFKKF